MSGFDSEFVLRKGEYRLFFLRPHRDLYEVVDRWFGALPISRELGPAPEVSDSMYLLELDLKAGLGDPDHDRVLDSIQMLGCMKRLHSITELKQLAEGQDLLVQTYVWQALLRLKDYSVLRSVAEFFDSQPEPPRELLLPRDRLLYMQDELANELGTLRDPNTLPYLERFAVSGKTFVVREESLQALRAIESPHSTSTFLRALDDPNSDNAFSAMQGLLSLGGTGPMAWVPTWKQFDENPRYYAAKCREWWRTEGHEKAGATLIQ